MYKLISLVSTCSAHTLFNSNHFPQIHQKKNHFPQKKNLKSLNKDIRFFNQYEFYIKCLYQTYVLAQKICQVEVLSYII